MTPTRQSRLQELTTSKPSAIQHNAGRHHDDFKPASTNQPGKRVSAGQFTGPRQVPNRRAGGEERRRDISRQHVSSRRAKMARGLATRVRWTKAFTIMPSRSTGQKSRTPTADTSSVPIAGAAVSKSPPTTGISTPSRTSPHGQTAGSSLLSRKAPTPTAARSSTRRRVTTRTRTSGIRSCICSTAGARTNTAGASRGTPI